MWLFDDILKKPTSPQDGDPLASGGAMGMGGGQSSWQSWGTTGKDPESELVVPQVFKIEKTEGSSIFGNNTPPAEVSITSTPIQTASGEDSLIILSNNSDTSTQSPLQMTNDVIAPVISTETPLITVEASSNSLMDMIQDQAPETTTPISETTIAMTDTTPIDPAPSLSTPSNDAIFGNFADFMTPPGELANSSVVPTVAQEEPILASPLIETAPIVEMPVENLTESVDEIVTQTPVESSENSFFHPTEFIQKSITEIDTMIANIDQKHETKITEAEGYKAEKKRFTELEKMAYAEAETMDEEKDHALHMKELLLNELPENKKNTEKNSHVETTLTGMAVVNTVEKTIESPKHHTKAKLAA